jgi:protein tyrosine phosphatase (PTP) superfamily phosphohydrolase (DUF442 family)
MSMRVIHGICLVGLAVTAAVGAVWSYHAFVFVDNFDAIVPGKLYRSSQPRLDDYDKLVGYGIVRLIDTRGAEEGRDDRRRHAGTLRRMGIDLVHIPITRQVPPVEKIDAFFRAVDSAPGAVLMHCQHGEDRTGILGAAWRVARQGWSIDKALHEMARHRCRIRGAKRRTVRELLASLKNRPDPSDPTEGALP